MTGKTLNARKRRVFDSVFGKEINLSQPTPVTTPATGFTVLGQAFGAPLPLERHSPRRPLGEIGLSRVPSLGAEEHVEDQVRWDRAWHLITHTLSPPEFKASKIGLDGLKPEKGNLDSRFFDALADVIAPQTRVPLARQTEDIVGWYTGQVRYHFLHQALQILLKLRDRYSQEQLLSKSFAVLRVAQLQYRHGLSFIVEGFNSFVPNSSRKAEEKFWRDLHAIVSNSVMEPLADALTAVLRRQVSTILGLPDLKDPESTAISPESEKTEKTRREMLELVEKFRYVGLIGERFQVTFAEIMNDAMTEYVHRGCKGVWSPGDVAKDQTNTEERDISILPRTAHHSSPSRCVTQLCEWIENRYAKLAVQVMSILDTKASITWTDKEKYKEMSIGRLAELRINELFDIVVNWPHSRGALDDLRTAITTPQRRLHLTEVFAKTLEEKLLHPGASTLQILQTYISMIWSFHALDHSKVLLDRVAYPLQLYLCSREDTVRIIITGLLSETEDAQGNPIKNAADRLVELAHLLNDDSERFGQRANDEELDWHDLDWVPDPVDAGPGYKRSKNADVIGTLIGVLGAQEVFIKEFQNILGENLLKHDTGLEKQVQVLELLKLRFGESPLQACEVMIKDITDGRGVNTQIRHSKLLGTPFDNAVKPPATPFSHIFAGIEAIPEIAKQLDSQRNVKETSLHAKILSRLFWPQLSDETFKVPGPVENLQKEYEKGFENLKEKRKLTWLPALGMATVELELQDRTMVEEVHTWQASVIYAFQEEEEEVVGGGRRLGTNQGVAKTVEQLVEELEMDEDLITSALRFWVHKLVLQEVSPSAFQVLETLNPTDRALSNLHSGPAPSSALPDHEREDSGMGGVGKKGKEGIMGDKQEQIYWQFVQGMLKNSQKEMPVGQIGMMMKMLITDGFPYSNEELGEWLGGKVRGGELEMGGAGRFRLKK